MLRDTLRKFLRIHSFTHIIGGRIFERVKSACLINRFISIADIDSCLSPVRYRFGWRDYYSLRAIPADGVRTKNLIRLTKPKIKQPEIKETCASPNSQTTLKYNHNAIKHIIRLQSLEITH